MIKYIAALIYGLYFLSATLYSGPLQSKLSKPVSGNEKTTQEQRALVAAGQRDGAAAVPAAQAAQAVICTMASLAHVQRLKRCWDSYAFRNWLNHATWSFHAVGYDGSRRAFTSLSCSPDGNNVAAGEYITWPIPVFTINHTTGALERVNDTYEHNKLGFEKVAYSPNSKHIAALRGGAISHDPCLALFDVDAASGRLTPTKGFKEIVQEFSSSAHIAYSPNGKWLALSNNAPDNGQWAPRSVDGGKFLTMFAVNQETGGLVERFAMTERGYIRALIDYLNPRRYIYTEQYESVGPYTNIQTETRAIQFSPDSDWLITVDSLNFRVNVFNVDTNTGRLTFTSSISSRRVGDIAFFPDGRYVAISHLSIRPAVTENETSYDFALFQFNEGSLEFITGLPSKITDTDPLAIAVSPGGKTVAVVHKAVHLEADNSILTVFRFDQGTKKLTQVPGSPFAAPVEGARSVCYSPNGELLFVGSAADDRIWVYEVDELTGSLDFITGKPLLKVQKKYDYAVSLLQENKYLISPLTELIRAYCYHETGAPKKPTQEH